MAIAGDELKVFLVGAAALGTIVLCWALWLAIRSRRPARPKPPRKTFEHGRRMGRARSPRSTQGALKELQASPVGDITSVQALDGRVDVVVARRRSQPCTQAAGYLAGLFESAWAHEVLVTHPECGGEGAGTCRYVVQRANLGAQRTVSASGAPGGGASTRGSADAPRRSPPARAGRG